MTPEVQLPPACKLCGRPIFGTKRRGRPRKYCIACAQDGYQKRNAERQAKWRAEMRAKGEKSW